LPPGADRANLDVMAISVGRADPQLQRSLLGEAMDTAELAVFVFEDDEHYVAVNDAACELSGYTREELLELPLRDLAAEPELALRNLKRVASGERTSGSARMRRKDGTVIELEYRAARATIAGMPFLVALYWRPDGA
jgi:PAS domain S-box-containing protein